MDELGQHTRFIKILELSFTELNKTKLEYTKILESEIDKEVFLPHDTQTPVIIKSKSKIAA